MLRSIFNEVVVKKLIPVQKQDELKQKYRGFYPSRLNTSE